MAPSTSVSASDSGRCKRSQVIFVRRRLRPEEDSDTYRARSVADIVRAVARTSPACMLEAQGGARESPVWQSPDTTAAAGCGPPDNSPGSVCGIPKERREKVQNRTMRVAPPASPTRTEQRETAPRVPATGGTNSDSDTRALSYYSSMDAYWEKMRETMARRLQRSAGETVLAQSSAYTEKEEV